MIQTFRTVAAILATRLLLARHDDRGDIPAQTAWVGTMLVLALGVVAIIAAKTNAFAEGLSFDSP